MPNYISNITIAWNLTYNRPLNSQLPMVSVAVIDMAEVVEWWLSPHGGWAEYWVLAWETKPRNIR